MDCCNKPCEKIEGDITYCGNCYSQWESPEFDNTMKLDFRSLATTRSKKFKSFILDKNVLPWYVTQTLIDLFPTIERHFLTTERVNFVNISQLVISLLDTIGYPEYKKYFSPLKTKNRVQQIEKFVKDAVTCNFTGSSHGLMRLEDIPLVNLRATEINPIHLEKSLDNAPFTDRFCPVQRPV